MRTACQALGFLNNRSLPSSYNSQVGTMCSVCAITVTYTQRVVLKLRIDLESIYVFYGIDASGYEIPHHPEGVSLKHR